MLSRKVTILLALAIVIVVASSVIALSFRGPEADRTPPGKVTGLKAIDLREGRVLLIWDATHDNVMVGFYRVFRDNSTLGRNPSIPMIVDSPGDVGVRHKYSVQAVDISGNEGEVSDAVYVSSLPTDLVPPSKVTGLAVHDYESQLNLTWDKAWDNDAIDGYRIYRNGELLDLEPSREHYVDLNATPMTLHEYRVSAVDVSGNEGPLSDPAEGYLPPGRAGQQALDFNLTDVYGRDFGLDDFEGKVVVLDFLTIASPNCPPQEEELTRIFDNYSLDDLQIVSIDVIPDTDPQELIIFKETVADDWIFAVDTNNVSEKYGVTAVPTEIVIDQSGTIVYVHVGIVSAEELRDVINPLIHI